MTEPEREGWISKIFQEMLFAAARSHLLEDKDVEVEPSPRAKPSTPLNKSASFWPGMEAADEFLDPTQVTKENEITKTVWSGTFKVWTLY